jgi:hypothetical protein
MPHVDMLVATEFLPDLGDGLAILGATEVSRAAADEFTTRVTIDMAYVPEGALTVTPVFVNTETAVRVQSLSWTFPDAEPSGSGDDEDEEQVECWHYEANTPCDWNVCRQPERLARGDRGIDPRDLA